VEAIEPFHLIRAAVSGGSVRLFPSDAVAVVSAGKAAWPMARAFASFDELPGLWGGVVAGPRGESQLPGALEWFNAGHPSPDASGEAAGRKALSVAAQSRARGVLVVLLSGGASSMLAVPAAGLTLMDKAETAHALMRAGVPIAELNCVRKHLSAIKGGRLAAAAGRTVTLAISDVHTPVPDDPTVIGSGPTVADPTTFADALSIVRRAGVERSVPPTVIAHLERGNDETPKPGDPRLGRSSDSSYDVIASRTVAMDGAARAASALGYEVRMIAPATSGEARIAGAAFAAEALRDARGAGRPLCVIASGETTVRVTGTGRGGRNQEFVLAAIPALDAAAGTVTAVMASAGTDGIDGPTDAAGAIADTSSSVRAVSAGVDAGAALASNGAYDFFRPLGDLIMWGPTGTNVGDVHVMLVRESCP
jgi:hydroxypyruvate reductase